jgi:hypothetical protein
LFNAAVQFATTFLKTCFQCLDIWYGKNGGGGGKQNKINNAAEDFLPSADARPKKSADSKEAFSVRQFTGHFGMTRKMQG